MMLQPTTLKRRHDDDDFIHQKKIRVTFLEEENEQPEIVSMCEIDLKDWKFGLYRTRAATIKACCKEDVQSFIRVEDGCNIDISNYKGPLPVGIFLDKPVSIIT